jgi:hypothetical protein
MRWLLIVLAFAGCSGGPSERFLLCKEGMFHVCERMLACLGELVPDEGGPSVTVGQCADDMASMECTSKELSCPEGTTYDPTKDQECADGFSAWTCEDLNDPDGHWPAPPPACQERCQ